MDADKYVYILEQYSENHIVKVTVFGKYQDAVDERNRMIDKGRKPHNLLVVTYPVK